MFIAGTVRGETSVNLSVHLKNCDGGFSVPEDVDFLVNYGRTDIRNADLNKRLINNKKEQIQIFQRAGLNAPDVYNIDWNQSRSYPYPIIARKYHHCKGTEAIFLRSRKSWSMRRRRVSTRHYFVKYISKSEEFRVHVCGEEAVGISTKIQFENVEEHHPHIWSRDRGWGQVDYNGSHSQKLKELGVEALKSLNYDFGAVDIFLGQDGKFYVLEVNSAPRLNRRRRLLYTDFFRRKYNEKFPSRRPSRNRR